MNYLYYFSRGRMLDPTYFIGEDLLGDNNFSAWCFKNYWNSVFFLIILFDWNQILIICFIRIVFVMRKNFIELIMKGQTMNFRISLLMFDQRMWYIDICTNIWYSKMQKIKTDWFFRSHCTCMISLHIKRIINFKLLSLIYYELYFMSRVLKFL